MVKLIGLLFIMSGIISLAFGVFIDIRYGVDEKITANVIEEIIRQPEIYISFFDYLEAAAFSYSVLSFIMGFVFLSRF